MTSKYTKKESLVQQASAAYTANEFATVGIYYVVTCAPNARDLQVRQMIVPVHLRSADQIIIPVRLRSTDQLIDKLYA